MCGCGSKRASRTERDGPPVTTRRIVGTERDGLVMRKPDPNTGRVERLPAWKPRAEER